VGTSFEAIEDKFSELRTFILDDLSLITRPLQGGNYAAALLVVTACEAVGRLRYGRADGGLGFFRVYLVPEKWRPVSGSIYNALRNGLAHSFLTKVILKAADNPIELGISKYKEQHFKYDPGRSILFINIQSFAKDLKEAFHSYEEELKRDKVLRDRFINTIKKQRVIQVRDPKEKEAWRKLIKQQMT